MAISLIAFAAVLQAKDKPDKIKPEKIHNVPDATATLPLLAISLAHCGGKTSARMSSDEQFP